MTTTAAAPRLGCGDADGTGRAGARAGQAVRRAGRRRRRRPRGAARGRCFALLGPNGAGKTTTIEILEGVRKPGRRRRARARGGPGGAGRALAGAHRRGRPGRGPAEELTVRGDARPLRRLPRDATADGELLAAVGLEEKAGTRVGRLSGRAASPARGRARRAGPARARVPRRADHRHGPGRPAPVLGADPAAARRRHDRRPHHPLPGRGGASWPTGSASSPTAGWSRWPRPASSARTCGRRRTVRWTEETAAREVSTDRPAAVLRDLLAGIADR